MPNAEMVGRGRVKAKKMKNGLVVSGCPRSGTTLMYMMLRYAVEGSVFALRESSASEDSKKMRINKQPRQVFYPSRQMILMIRDPRGIVTSHHAADKFQGANKNYYFIGMRSGHSIQNKTVPEYAEAIRAAVADERCTTLVVRYEDLIDLPDTVQFNIKARFGLRFRPGARFSDFWKADHGSYWDVAANGVRPLEPPRDWRQHPERIGQEFADPAHRELVERWQYEVNDGWYQPYSELA